MDGVKQLVMGLKESATGEASSGQIAAEAYASLSVEPVAWPEVGQFDRLLQCNAETERSET